MAQITGLKRLIISAPFGNYIQPEGATATLGTYTALRRPGRLWRVLRTVRYYRRIDAWVNKIGLRNPGIDHLAQQVEAGRINAADKILSIHGFDDGQWYTLLEKARAIGPLAIELNMSCPNVGCIEWPLDLFARAVSTGAPVIVKLPPVNYGEILRQALEAGVRTLHCCNTLPSPGGGVSGAPLKPVALECIRTVLRETPEAVRRELRIIGGGGIRRVSDIDLYADAGAHHVAIATKVFSPRYLWSAAGVAPLIEHAERKLAGR